MSIRDTALVHLAVREHSSIRGLSMATGMTFGRIQRLMKGGCMVRGVAYASGMKPYERHTLRRVLK